MKLYKLKIATGTDLCAGTIDIISVVLVGVDRESAKHQLSRLWIPGTVKYLEISTAEDLGELLFVRLYKEPKFIIREEAWYCEYINVICPSGHFYQFPFYQWLSGLMTVEVPEGKGIISNRSIHPAINQQQKTELENKRETRKWKTYADGIPHCIDVEKVEDLHYNDQYSAQKKTNIGFNLVSTSLEVHLKGLKLCTKSWTNLEDIKTVFCFRRTDIADKVAKIWKEDSFFGYQHLNGINPMMIRKCYKIPDNFPVCDKMVVSSLGSSTDLQKELQNGNIFLVDYKILQGIPSNNSINQKQQYIVAPMCLLWKNLQDTLVPIAIQLDQTPGEQTPIFLPSDSEWDWTLAKIWVRNSEFLVHQAIYHLLQTHFIAEVFNIATTRQLPMCHPVIYLLFIQMLVPHLRFTLQINTISRSELLGPKGIFNQIFATGSEGIIALMKKAMEEMTYNNLCLPDDIKTRGMETIPNYLYRDDGMKIWTAVESFVSSIVHYYYDNDEMVCTDRELQAWVAEIFKEGFLEHKSSGIPSSLETIASLIKYLTMVIFTCSAQHAAVNSGQFDFYYWMPNGPTSMKRPPPTTKGGTTFQSILDALPDVNTTTTTMIILWILSKETKDTRYLGYYPDVRFTEKDPQKFIKDFKDELAEISRFITKRNESMSFPYPYLDPRTIENSISI
ncbi:polyunsaturated fatty acid lipoxygenase ALOX15B-like [Mixophyes fleayi]|uniref:polyunsaturated fatty acid lipoxygenase ALOX15B-like n=1 Tax=Mixophyes fleayi TaxID=3061075 RepID=UPI003F4D751E